MDMWIIELSTLGIQTDKISVLADNEDDAIFRAGFTAAMMGNTGSTFQGCANPIIAQLMNGYQISDVYLEDDSPGDSASENWEFKFSYSEGSVKESSWQPIREMVIDWTNQSRISQVSFRKA